MFRIAISWVKFFNKMKVLIVVGGNCKVLAHILNIAGFTQFKSQFRLSAVIIVVIANLTELFLQDLFAKQRT